MRARAWRGVAAAMRLAAGAALLSLTLVAATASGDPAPGAAGAADGLGPTDSRGADTLGLSDSVLVRFTTRPSVAGLEIRRAAGPMLFLETPAHVRFPRRERIEYEIRLSGYYPERGMVDLREAEPVIDLHHTLTPTTQIFLDLQSEPPASEILVRAIAGEILLQGGEQIRTWLSRQPVSIEGRWADGGRCSLEENLLAISAREYARTLAPFFRRVLLTLHTYPPAALTIRQVAGNRTLRGLGTFAAELEKDVLAVIARWPDGEIQQEELNLLAIPGREFEKVLWKKQGRVAVAIRSDPAATLRVSSAAGDEDYRARGAFEGWLAPQPYDVVAEWGADSSTTLRIAPAVDPGREPQEWVLRAGELIAAPRLAPLPGLLSAPGHAPVPGSAPVPGLAPAAEDSVPLRDSTAGAP